ncbi:MAG: FHA domain-containing protein [Deltaproteobacteria bacterium]|nr:FHA domain-containing protein [Deltaproteobacteria bacterium]
MADTTTWQTPPSGEGARPSATLRILYGLERGKRFELVGSQFTLGRGGKADVVLGDPSIEEVHALLLLQDGGARIRDLGTSAGLRVNGRIVDVETPLQDGAQIELGGMVLAFQTAAAAAQPETAAQPAGDPPWARGSVGTGGAVPPPLPTVEAPPVRVETSEQQVRSYADPGRGIRWIRVGGRRSLATQLVSWVVILAVLLASLWVVQTLLEDRIRLPALTAPTSFGALSHEPGEEQEQGPGTPPPAGIGFEPGLAPGAPGVEAPDRARAMFDEAMRAHWNERPEEAISILKDLLQAHPDFEPPLGEPVDQIITRIGTRTRYRDFVSSAATVMAARTATGSEVREALEGLAEIPPTDTGFGPVAELYRRNLEERLEELGEEPAPGGLPGAGAEGVEAEDGAAAVGEAGEEGDDEAAEDDTDGEAADDEAAEEDEAPEDDDGEGDDEFGEMDEDLARDEDGEVVQEGGTRTDPAVRFSRARQEARRLYREARFADAARLFALLRQEGGLPRAQAEQALYLERKLLAFGAAFDEGMEAVDDPGTARQGVRRLEAALEADHVLFRYYERLLAKRIGAVSLELAAGALDKGDLAEAGEHLERGSRRAPELDGWAAVRDGVTVLAASRLETLRETLATDPDGARTVLKQIVAAAPEGSTPFTEAAALLEAMDRDADAPVLPARDSF